MNIRNTIGQTLKGLAGAGTGLAGGIGGVLGSDPQRKTPATEYGKKNKSFGAAYNVTSAPGKVVYEAGKAVGNGLKDSLRKLKGAM